MPPHAVVLSMPNHEVAVSMPTHIVAVSTPTHTVAVSMPPHIVAVSMPPHIVAVSMPFHIVDIGMPPHVVILSMPNHAVAVSMPTHTVAVGMPTHSGCRYASPHSGCRYATLCSDSQYAKPCSGCQYANPCSGCRYASPHSGCRYATPYSGCQYATPCSGCQYIFRSLCSIVNDRCTLWSYHQLYIIDLCEFNSTYLHFTRSFVFEMFMTYLTSCCHFDYVFEVVNNKCVFVCRHNQLLVTKITDRQTDTKHHVQCNVFSVSVIIRILQTSHHKSASVPEQDMPEFPNLLYSNATRNCSELLTAPKSNTHAAVSVAEKCNIRVNMCLWVSLPMRCSTFSWPTHERALQSICFLLLWSIVVSYRGQCSGDLFLKSDSWTNRRKHYELRYKTNSYLYGFFKELDRSTSDTLFPLGHATVQTGNWILTVRRNTALPSSRQIPAFSSFRPNPEL
jgi:hypothetical protein